MKTEQEQIEKMARIMCGYCSTDGKCTVSQNLREPDICANVDTEHCLFKEYAERLFEDGCYGDVSEYKAEIERLKEETSNIRKETAKEIYEKTKEKDSHLLVWEYGEGYLDCLKNLGEVISEYGVEV